MLVQEELTTKSGRPQYSKRAYFFRLGRIIYKDIHPVAVDALPDLVKS